jgi:mercuric ion binding protein
MCGLTMLACGGSQSNSSVAANSNATFKIWGNCEMCKETIEGSLKTDGIKTADWNKDTKIMAVAFDSTKITLDQIEQRVAAVGYDTEKFRGDDHAYAGLPECCQYQRK